MKDKYKTTPGEQRHKQMLAKKRKEAAAKIRDDMNSGYRRTVRSKRHPFNHVFEEVK